MRAALLFAALCLWCSAQAGESLAERWLKAVGDGDSTAALKLASRMVGPVAVEPGSERYKCYAHVLADGGVSSEFLGAGFNLWDYQLWEDAAFFQALAQALSAKSKTPEARLRDLLDAVVAKVEVAPAADASMPRARKIWESGRGGSGGCAWVMAELAYQLGFEAQVLLLFDKGGPERALCELRLGSDVWLAAPAAKLLLPGKTLTAKRDWAPCLAKLFPLDAKRRDAVAGVAYFTSSPAQDYCPRNQLLRGVLSRELQARCPRFGEDPLGRQKLFLKAIDAKPEGGLTAFKLWLWPVPPRALAAEMRALDGAASGSIPK